MKMWPKYLNEIEIEKMKELAEVSLRTGDSESLGALRQFHNKPAKAK